jgi:cystathionine beta-lyase
MTKPPRKASTIVTHGGRHPRAYGGVVNTPVVRASTVLFPTVEAQTKGHQRRLEPGHLYYGRMGTPTTFGLEEAVAELEGGHAAVTVSSGLAAVATALMAFAGSGDHILVTDSVYGPVRGVCDRLLARFGVETTYYDPLIGAGISALIRPNTRAVYLESPGSLTFEVQDVPAIAAAATAAGIAVVLDNTWATPLYFHPFDHGVTVSVHAATKYIGGHSDLMLGLLVCDEASYQGVRVTALLCGNCGSPDDAYLAARGLRTLDVRLARHQESAQRIARWLDGRPEVAKVLCPALPSCPGHDLWHRDFTGCSGLFSIVLKDVPERAVAAMLDGFELFGLGFSWGGFESLVAYEGVPVRTAKPWRAEGPLVRFHVGLEDTDDLIADLERGLERLVRAS